MTARVDRISDYVEMMFDFPPLLDHEEMEVSVDPVIDDVVQITVSYHCGDKTHTISSIEYISENMEMEGPRILNLIKEAASKVIPEADYNRYAFTFHYGTQLDSLRWAQQRGMVDEDGSVIIYTGINTDEATPEIKRALWEAERQGFDLVYFV